MRAEPYNNSRRMKVFYDKARVLSHALGHKEESIHHPSERLTKCHFRKPYLDCMNLTSTK